MSTTSIAENVTVAVTEETVAGISVLSVLLTPPTGDPITITGDSIVMQGGALAAVHTALLHDPWHT